MANRGWGLPLRVTAAMRASSRGRGDQEGSRFRTQGSGFRVQGSGFRLQSSGLRVLLGETGLVLGHADDLGAAPHAQSTQRPFVGVFQKPIFHRKSEASCTIVPCHEAMRRGRVQGSGFRVQGCRVQGLGFRVQGGGHYSERRGSSLGTPMILELGPFWSSVFSIATTRI